MLIYNVQLLGFGLCKNVHLEYPLGIIEHSGIVYELNIRTASYLTSGMCINSKYSSVFVL